MYDYKEGRCARERWKSCAESSANEWRENDGCVVAFNCDGLFLFFSSVSNFDRCLLSVALARPASSRQSYSVLCYSGITLGPTNTLLK